MSHLQFNCDSCQQLIAAVNPRVHCLVCPNYDLCANCTLGERFTMGHTGGHNTQVFKQSGGTGRQPVPGTIFSTPAPAPPVGPPRYTEDSQPPPLPPRGAPGPSSPPASGSATQWQPWFHPDSSPTPAFVTLMNDIFSYLDPTNLGNLVPETFSRFMDDMGYLTHENSWKMGLQETFALSKESMADKSLKNAFDLFSIDHILLQRVQPPHVDKTGLTSTFQRVLGSAFKPSMMADPSMGHSTIAGPMPAITRNGFIEICRIEALSDPSREWGNFSRLVRKYNLPRYRGWGDIPRSVLPPVPDAAMLQRIAGVKAYAQAKGEEALAAARINAEIRAKGNQAAIDLVSDTRRVEYRYY